jgi:hypothetical protein
MYHESFLGLKWLHWLDPEDYTMQPTWLIRALTVTALAGLALISAGGAAPAASGGAPPPPPAPSGPVADLPLVLEQGRITVMVGINGQGPFKFILDTGAEGHVISAALASKLGLKVLGTDTVSSPGGKGMISRRVQIDVLSLENYEEAGARAVTLPRGLFAGRDTTVVGVLSPFHFQGALVTLDFPHKRLRIERGALPEADGRQVLDWRGTEHLPLIRASVAGLLRPFHLDTAAPPLLALPLSLSDQLPLEADPVEFARGRRVDREISLYRARLRGNVNIGDWVVRNPEIVFSEEPDSMGLIGIGLLGHSVVTMDAAHHRVRLAPDLKDSLAFNPGEPDAGKK